MDSREMWRILDADGDLRAPLESVVARALFEGGLWPSPRISDGVSSYRVVERDPTRVRVCGYIWSIDQTLHSFWLAIEREATFARWTLYFDIDTTTMSPRQSRHAIDALRDPTDVTWATTLTG